MNKIETRSKSILEERDYNALTNERDYNALTNVEHCKEIKIPSKSILTLLFGLYSKYLVATVPQQICYLFITAFYLQPIKSFVRRIGV